MPAESPQGHLQEVKEDPNQGPASSGAAAQLVPPKWQRTRLDLSSGPRLVTWILRIKEATN